MEEEQKVELGYSINNRAMDELKWVLKQNFEEEITKIRQGDTRALVRIYKYPEDDQRYMTTDGIIKAIQNDIISQLQAVTWDTITSCERGHTAFVLPSCIFKTNEVYEPIMMGEFGEESIREFMYANPEVTKALAKSFESKTKDKDKSDTNKNEETARDGTSEVERIATAYRRANPKGVLARIHPRAYNALKEAMGISTDVEPESIINPAGLVFLQRKLGLENVTSFITFLNYFEHCIASQTPAQNLIRYTRNDDKIWDYIVKMEALRGRDTHARGLSPEFCISELHPPKDAKKFAGKSPEAEKAITEGMKPPEKAKLKC